MTVAAVVPGVPVVPGLVLRPVSALVSVAAVVLGFPVVSSLALMPVSALVAVAAAVVPVCLLYTSPSPRDRG